MARVTFNGEPGSTWRNDGTKAQYQLIVDWNNSCGLCCQYDHAIGPWWPIPFHRGCRCKQIPIWPGKTSQPFVDFREKIRALDRPQRSRVIGAANLKLAEAGVVKWGDVATSGRVRTLEEVVARGKLTVEEMVKAGVQRSTAEKAWTAVNTPEHVLVEAQRQSLVKNLEALGVGRREIAKRVGEGLAAKLGIGAGPSGPSPSRMPTGETAVALALALGVRFKMSPGHPDVNIARAVAIAERMGVKVDPQGFDTMAANRDEGLIAAYYRDDDLIRINQRNEHWIDPAADMSKLFADGTSSTKSPDHVIRHEVGHALHLRNIDEETRADLQTNSSRQKAREVGELVSEQARINPFEFVAEVFAGLLGGQSYHESVVRTYNAWGGQPPR